ncbi:MAG: tetrahydrofolate synthase [Flavobacteriales bacterium MED-G22]|nr:MAG: tetrahydrofolate synthase [Flavobacteriales bacterium MED-G22]
MKTYNETVEWLYHKLPIYQRIGASAYRPGLERIHKIVDYLGNPHNKFQSIHIAGTNGKGSTAHLIASVFQQAGYKVGLYTSPHLKDFNERVRVNGTAVERKEIVDFVAQHKTYFDTHKSSFFEMTVGLAFDRFAFHQVDIAIVEVGLGGRLDATNIITPVLSIITNIGLDHTQFLGDSRSAIAREKAGIIKNKIPILIGEKDAETQPVFEEVAKKCGAAVHWANDLVERVYESDLVGEYQKENIRLAQATVQLLPQFKISQKNCKEGFLSVVKNTGIKGRWQCIGTAPMIVADVAHNKEGISQVVSQIRKQRYQTLHLVLGFVQDKEIMPIVSLLPDEAKLYLCAANNPRSLQLNNLEKYVSNKTSHYSTYSSVAAAFSAAKNNAKSSDFIYVGGSTFVVAEVL